MLPIDLLAGKLRAPDAYFEGTFNYYLWAVPEMLYELRGGARPIIGQNFPADQFKFVVLCGRLMSVAFDLITLVLVYAVIRGLSAQPLGAILGALLYGLFPMQVIYSHFMRTHALSNLLCVVVILLSIKALNHRHWLLFVIAGVTAGLAAATRYSTAVVLGMPCLFILFEDHGNHEPWRLRFRRSTAYLLSGPLWLLAGGFVLGVFAGEPMLLFDFKRVVDAISFEISHYAPAGARNPLDLAPIWRYFSVFIPYATYPLLWLVIYLSTLYVILRRSFWPIVIPFCLFAALYTYSMAKGYSDIFARQVMPLLPVFCIFAGLAFGDILPKLLKRRPLFAVVMILSFLLIIPTILFDWAYGRAMRRRDVREILRADMRELIKDRSSTSIAVREGGSSFYTAMPAVLPLKSNNVAVELQSSLTAPADFFVMGFEGPLPENSRNFVIRYVESGGVFRFMKAYSRAPTLLGRSLDLSNFPPDMTYPFPTILLFRKVTTPLTNPTPANDALANAIDLGNASSGGPVFGDNTNVGANETNEVAPGGSTQSVWYKWTALAARDTFFVVMQLDQRIDIYTGTAHPLTTVVNDTGKGWVTWTAVAGTTYRIRVAARSGKPAAFDFRWTQLIPLANDAFANAILVSGYQGRPLASTTVGATREVGEPDGDNSVWYKWVGVTTGKWIGFWAGSTDFILEILRSNCQSCACVQKSAGL